MGGLELGGVQRDTQQKIRIPVMLTMRKRIYPVVLILAVICVWQLLSGLGILNPFILPSPVSITLNFIGLLKDGRLIADAIASLRRVIIGFLISAITAIPLGLTLGMSWKLRELLEPIINFIRPIPPIAWIPLAILWFGIGNGPSYFITMIASFFPIFLNTLTGVENVSEEHRDVAKCFGADERMVLFQVIIPSSLPFLFSGMRIGLGMAWMAVVAAEMIAAFSGLGYLIIISQEMLRVERVVVGMMIIGLLGLILDQAVVRLKDRIIRWS